jgi:hypothetical protein
MSAIAGSYGYIAPGTVTLLVYFLHTVSLSW